MPLLVYFLPTTASPPEAQITLDVRTAIGRDGASLGPDGMTLVTTDGAKVAVDGRLENFQIEALSPSLCRILFDAALAANATIDRGGSDLTPLQMAGARGHTRYIRMRVDRIATPDALCARLSIDLAEWNKFVSQSQAAGTMDAAGQMLAPPPDPGDEPRVASDGAAVATRCEAEGAAYASSSGERVVRAVATQSSQFGVVWRADVEWKRFNDTFRLVCWQPKSTDGSSNIVVEHYPMTMFDPSLSAHPLPASDAYSPPSGPASPPAP